MTAPSQGPIGSQSTLQPMDMLVISTATDSRQLFHNISIEFEEIAEVTSGVSRSYRASILLFAGSFVLLFYFICLMVIIYVGFVRFFQPTPVITID